MIYIVSGFHRSGTSLMMHLLKQAGAAVVYDEARDELFKGSNPDINPYYYEHPSYMLGQIVPIELEGKTVKVFGEHLSGLPDYEYRVIFMHRTLTARLKSAHLTINHPDVLQNLTKQMDLMVYAVNRFGALLVDYDQLIDDPVGQIHRVSQFMPGLGLFREDMERLAKEVRPELRHYRGDNDG